MLNGPTKKKRRKWYTDENPSGPWSRALEAMGERARRIEEFGCSGSSKEESKDDRKDEKKTE